MFYRILTAAVAILLLSCAGCASAMKSSPTPQPASANTILKFPLCFDEHMADICLVVMPGLDYGLGIERSPDLKIGPNPEYLTRGCPENSIIMAAFFGGSSDDWTRVPNNGGFQWKLEAPHDRDLKIQYGSFRRNLPTSSTPTPPDADKSRPSITARTGYWYC